MKKLSLLVVLLCASLVTIAQDVIVKKDGATIQRKVLEINSTEIKYKKWSNQEGPLYSINRKDVLNINYQNGEVESFTNEFLTTNILHVLKESWLGRNANYFLMKEN